MAARKARATIEANSGSGFTASGNRVTTGSGLVLEPGIFTTHVRNLITKAELGAPGRLDQTLPWLFLISCGQQRLAVIGVAMGLNLRVIGRTFGCSHETVRTRERAGIAALVRALNS